MSRTRSAQPFEDLNLLAQQCPCYLNLAHVLGRRDHVPRQSWTRWRHDFKVQGTRNMYLPMVGTPYTTRVAEKDSSKQTTFSNLFK